MPLDREPSREEPNEEQTCLGALVQACKNNRAALPDSVRVALVSLEQCGACCEVARGHLSWSPQITLAYLARRLREAGQRAVAICGDDEAMIVAVDSSMVEAIKSVIATKENGIPG